MPANITIPEIIHVEACSRLPHSAVQLKYVNCSIFIADCTQKYVKKNGVIRVNLVGPNYTCNHCELTLALAVHITSVRYQSNCPPSSTN